MRPTAVQWRLHTYAFEDRNDSLKSELFQLLSEMLLPDGQPSSAELHVNLVGARPFSSVGDASKVRRRMAGLVAAPEQVSSFDFSSGGLMARFVSLIDQDGEGYGRQQIRLISQNRGPEAVAASFDAMCRIAALTSSYEAAGFVEPSHNDWWPQVFGPDDQRARSPVIPYYGWCLLLPAPLGAQALAAGLDSTIRPFAIREVVPSDGGEPGIAVQVPETPDDFPVEARHAWRDFLVDTFDLTQRFFPTEL